MKLHWQQLQC
ncbi:putative membrane protein, partial [Yersinia pestis PY-15]